MLRVEKSVEKKSTPAASKPPAEADVLREVAMVERGSHWATKRVEELGADDEVRWNGKAAMREAWDERAKAGRTQR